MLKKLKGLLRRDPEQFRIPRSVQEVIPIRTVWKSGIFLVGSNRYSRTWQFSDINYALAGEEDQKSMLLGYSGLLNLCDSNASTKFSVVTRKLNRRDFEDYIMIPYANDGHDHYRREYNAMLLEKASHASGMIRDLYITVTVTRKSYKDAESYFVRAGAEFTLALSRLGSRCTELDMMDRLRALHGFYRHGEEADFHFDPALSMKLGHSFQDYICPDSFEFDRDHFRMGDRYGRVLFLKDYAAYLRDDILSELSGIDRPMILSIDVVPIPMDKAIWDSESRLLGVERNIVDFLRKQQANNNFSGTVPYDMEKQRAEMKEFLDDLTIRDQRMMLGMLTLVHTADSKEQLDADTDYIMNAATGRMCQMATLRFQQMDGLNTALPIGVQKLDILRTFTSESLAALMPFRVQEIMEPGGIYYGENAISGNLLALGGEVIEISATSQNHINAMDMVEGYGDGGNPVVDKSEFILSLFEQLDRGGIGPLQKSIIDRCVDAVYAAYKRGGPVPTLCVLREKLLEQPEEEARDLALALELFTTGSLDAFAHETNVDTQNRIVIYDIMDLGRQLKTMGLLIITDAMLNRVTENWRKGKRTHLFIDEFHVVFQNPYSADFFDSAWRRFRKRGAYPTAITQNVEYLLDSVQASTMLSNSEMLILLNQAPSDREKLAALLNISPEQTSYITNAPAGCGLLRYGGALVPFRNQFPKDTELYRLMTTKPDESIIVGGKTR